jgi:serine/threonine-protein kinase
LTDAEKLEDSLKPEDRQRFKFISFAGEGSFGRVYRCQDIKLQKIVALKLIKSECLGNELFIDLFKRECEFSKNIGEEHLVSTLDFCVDDEYAYSVMEYIEGIELNLYLKNKKSLKLKEFKVIAAQIACGLHFFHYHGLIHCDLKPSNIMINDETLKVKLVDFGLSHFKFEENILDKDMIGGTRGYMSPEQEAGVKALTPASDIYSVGVIYYELLTGARPQYDAEGELIPPSAFCDVLLSSDDQNYFNDESLDLDALSRDVVNTVDYLDLVVIRCLQKEPRSRFKSIEELKAVIEKAGHDFKLDIVFDKNYSSAASDKSETAKADEVFSNEDAAREGSAIKKIKHSTIMTKILAEPEEQKTSKTLLMKYNKPKGPKSQDSKSERTPESAAGSPQANYTKPSLRNLSEDKPKKTGTVYSGGKNEETNAFKYALTAAGIAAAAAAAYIIYSKYLI